MHSQCTRLAGALHATDWGSAVTVIDHWTGASATALRRAMRLSNEGFAAKLGVSVRAVAKWSAQPAITPTPQFQQMLDTVLGQLDDSARQRFSMRVAPPVPPPPPPTATTAVPAIDLQDFGGHLSDDEDMLRRQFLLSSAAAVTAAGLPGLAGSGKAPRLNAGNVNELETGDVNPTWPHRDGGGWPQLSCIRGLGLLGQPQKMQVGSRSSSLSRSSTRFDGASRS